MLMLLRSHNIVRGILTLAESILKPIPLKVTSPFRSYMGDRTPRKKVKYDGRSKKRQWEDRRTDKGEGLIIGIKKPKTDENQTPAEKTVDKIAEKIVDKIKRRKFCLLMGYSGDNYYGMQRNPNTKTIEEDLFKALLKVELINEECYNQVQNMQFQRAARTDKGVSAARQIVSMKLGENIDLAKINAELPEVIRVFAFKRVTKGFNSKSQCDSRTYIYVTPTVAFAPHNQEVSQKDYRLEDETYNRINDLLKKFLGTKNYHNYTSKKKPNDPSAKRYMKSFICDKPFVKDGVEFAILKVQGQSFMMHQIRKMVGCIIAIVRGVTTEDIIPNSFKMEKVCIPRAPGLGLVLDYVHYDRYNYRYGEDGTHEKLTWEEVEDEVKEFRDKYIFPNIIEKEIREESMLYWIENKLSRHSYDLDEDSVSDEECGGDDEDRDENVTNRNVGDDEENKSSTVGS